MKGMNKGGQQSTIPVIIAIVLGIAVLVFLIFGFSTGWNNMWSKIKELGGSGANVDDVVRGCSVACSAQNKYDFCTKKRTVNFDQEVELSAGSMGKSLVATCQEMIGDKYPNVNVASCPSISCS